MDSVSPDQRLSGYTQRVEDVTLVRQFRSCYQSLNAAWLKSLTLAKSDCFWDDPWGFDEPKPATPPRGKRFYRQAIFNIQQN